MVQQVLVVLELQQQLLQGPSLLLLLAMAMAFQMQRRMSS
jgi:hypothetical protein